MTIAIMKQSKSLYWHVYVVVVTVLIGLFLAWISNKLLIEETIKRAVTKAYVPLLSLDYPETGRDSISIITLDDSDLKSYGLTWPVRLDYYGRLVDRVAKSKPKAIFIDVLFLDDKPLEDIQRLVFATCAAAQNNIPIFLATFGRATLTSNAEKLLFSATTHPVGGQPCVRPVRPNITPDELDRSQWAYPLQTRLADEMPNTGKSPPPDSAARAIFCHLYTEKCSLGGSGQLEPLRLSEPLALIWATKSAASNQSIMVSPDEGGKLMPICRGYWNWWEAIPGEGVVRQLLDISSLPLCPYNQVIPMRAFQGAGFTLPQLEAELNGKIVLIGADLKAMGDNIFSPVHGRLPGIHAHAMALDNLISFHGNYRENGDFELNRGWNSGANIFIFCSVVLTAVFMVIWNAWRERQIEKYQANQRLTTGHFMSRTQLISAGSGRLVRGAFFILSPLIILTGYPGYGKRKEPLFLPFLYIIGCMLMGVLVFKLGYDVFRQGPLSIIEYVLFPFMANFLHLGEAIANRLKYVWAAFFDERPWDYLREFPAQDAE